MTTYTDRLRSEDWTVEACSHAQATAFIGEQPCSFHETLADSLLVKFGGMQTLVADHHGVRITTIRSAKC